MNLDQDIQNLEKWFDGRKFELEKIFRATEDGFHFDKSRPKIHSKNDIIFVVESEHGQKFGAYISINLPDNSPNSYIPDKQAFLFQLTK